MDRSPAPNRETEVVGVTEVELGKHCSPLDRNKGNERKGILALNGDVIHPPIIDAGPKSPVLLSHKKNHWPQVGG